MEKISINLLPLELRTQTKADIKKRLIVKLSVGILVFSIIVSALVLSWNIIQGQQLKTTSEKYQNLITKVKSNEKKEGQVFLLKKRLEFINQISQKESTQISAFNLVNNLVPPNVQLLNLAVKKNGSVELSCVTNSSQDMKVLLDNLTDPTQTEGKIKNTKVVNFTQTQTGYTFEISLEFAAGGIGSPIAAGSPIPAGSKSGIN